MNEQKFTSFHNTLTDKIEFRPTCVRLAAMVAKNGRAFVTSRQHPGFEPITAKSTFANQRLNGFKLFCCVFVNQPNRDVHLKDLRRSLAAIRPCGTVALWTELARTTRSTSGFARSSPFETPAALARAIGISCAWEMAVGAQVSAQDVREHAAMGRRIDKAAGGGAPLFRISVRQAMLGLTLF